MRTTPPAVLTCATIPRAWTFALVLAGPVGAQPVSRDPTTAQSVLHPAGTDAAAIANLFWIMTGAGALIWAAVIGTAIYAVLGRHKPQSERFADRFILAGGVIFPTVTLALLLVVGLRLLPNWRATDLPDLRVHVVGEQFWWRIRYETPDGGLVETANELHLPVGAEVEFVLTATDVIHSFWIPVLGGKLDMIPGRTTVLRLRPTATGVYRGACAEYCGLSHALMAMVVVVVPPDRFAEWLEAAARPARTPPPAAYLQAGCPACHVVRAADTPPEVAGVGPDLTHLAARSSLAADTLPLDHATLSGWIANPARYKPGARMPGFAHIDPREREAVVTWLMELQ
ncbi:MAG: cytochrome c oxidase subunit II [Gemmobacter sp.]|nr:cytochrome c oxidase subunit II [Gemmobacter sp.]